MNKRIILILTLLATGLGLELLGYWYATTCCNHDRFGDDAAQFFLVLFAISSWFFGSVFGRKRLVLALMATLVFGFVVVSLNIEFLAWLTTALEYNETLFRQFGGVYVLISWITIGISAFVASIGASRSPGFFPSD